MVALMPLVGRRIVESDVRPLTAERPVDPTPPAGVRYRDLDLWRGVACLGVILFHTSFDAADPEITQTWRTWVTGGGGGANLSIADCILALVDQLWMGVPIFFVISGYCIAASAERTLTKGRSVGDFLGRRLVRIYPPLWCYLGLAFTLVAILTATAPWMLEDAIHPLRPLTAFSPWQIGGSVTLTEMWRHHLVGDERHTLMIHLWTLCYEEQFYLVTAGLMLVFRRRLGLGVITVTAAVVGVVGALMVMTDAGRESVSGFFFDGYWLQFAAGTGVYFVVRHRRWWVTAGVVAALLAGIAIHIRNADEWFFQDVSFGQGCVAAYLFALFLITWRRWDGWLADQAALAPIAACGRMCYSLYLAHWPITKIVSQVAERAGLESSASTLAVTMPIAVLLSVLAGTGFYYLVERHCLPGTAGSRGTPQAP